VRDSVRGAAAIVRRDLLIASTQPFGLITRLVGSIVGVAGFYYVSQFVDPHHALQTGVKHGSYFSYVSVNLIFMMLQASALQSFAQSLRTDQILGTLEPILATPIAPGTYVIASGLFPLMMSSLQIVLTLAAASLLFGLDVGSTNLATLCAFAALSTATMAGLGMFAAAAVIALKQMPPSGYLVGGAGSLLAGTLFPVRLLPAPLQAISWCLPLTHSLAGLRGAVDGSPLRALSADAAWLSIAVLVLVPSAFVALRRTIEMGRRDGTLSQY